MLPASAGGAPAEVLSDLAGTYGNANGCKYEATGNYVDDGMVILKPDEYQTYVTLCEFLEVRSARDGRTRPPGGEHASAAPGGRTERTRGE